MQQLGVTQPTWIFFLEFLWICKESMDLLIAVYIFQTKAGDVPRLKNQDNNFSETKQQIQVRDKLGFTMSTMPCQQLAGWLDEEAVVNGTLVWNHTLHRKLVYTSQFVRVILTQVPC